MNLKIRASGEDYLETILELEQLNKNVKSVDVARKMNVSKPSVNKAITNLKNHGLVEQQLYGCIMLTEKGRNIAEAIADKHCVISNFLTSVLGVESNIANEDACKIEHLISDETFNKLKQFTESCCNAGEKNEF